jgi:DNA primase
MAAKVWRSSQQGTGARVPMASPDQKKQIKAANDIVDVVSGYLPVVAAGKGFKAVCPFHNDTRPSLTLDRQYQNFRCWACDAKGDVFDFVMKFDKVEFPEALRMLAERAGIALDERPSPEEEIRGRLIRAMKWAEDKYAHGLLEEPLAEAAREYLGERQLSGPTVRNFGLGFAPLAGDWLFKLAKQEGFPLGVLEEVGLLGKRDENRGYYDRFRDRVMFPIRDIRGQTVGFGGRILPTSPYAARGPKYYNSAETPLFKKSELIYGLDLARHAGSQAGYLAVVEGYTDVMMAHQFGVANVVATMGTALTATHVQQLRRYVPKVVLVFDGDEAGESATDRALELFWSQNDFDIGITSLPDGLDPCDLLLTPDGPARFRKALENHQSVLDYKLDALFKQFAGNSAEAAQQIVDRALSLIAAAPPVLSARHQLRQESAVTRISHRLGLRQETVWARLAELKMDRRRREATATRSANASPPALAPQKLGSEAAIERQLLEILLAEPLLVPTAMPSIPLDRVQHTGLKRILAELYALHDLGHPADLDGLRLKLTDRPDLLDAAAKLQYVGRQMNERGEWLKRIVAHFADRETWLGRHAVRQELANATDEAAAMALLRKLQGSKAPTGGAA